MSASQIIEEFDRLPDAEQRAVAEHVGRRLGWQTSEGGQPVLRRKSFESAQERVFQENAELLRLLAQ